MTLIRARGLWLCIGVCLAWLLLYGFAVGVLRVDLLNNTDSHAYLTTSTQLSEFRPLELPVFATFWAAAGVILDSRTAGELMSLTAYVASVAVLYLLLRESRMRFALPCTLLFAWFPLAGLSGAIMPRVNSSIYFWLFLGLYFYVRGQSWWSVAALAVALLTHKSLWVVVGLLTLFGVMERRFTPLQAAAIAVPLGLYWILGAAYHSDALWLLTDSIRLKVGNDWIVPFTGVVDAARRASGSLVQLARFAILGAFLLGNVGLIVSRIWRGRLWLLSLQLSPLVWAAVINSAEYWSVYNYAAYGVIPLCFWLETRRNPVSGNHWLWAGVLTAALASNILFVVYLQVYVS